MTARSRRLGIVSDTHGYFDPALVDLLRGVERIVHAGDIVGGSVLPRLEDIAPVDAIVGNNDGPPLTKLLPEWRILEFAGERILVVHDLGKPDRIRPPASALVKRERPTMVVSGHSHAGRLEERDGIVFVNPGSCGRKRFQLLRSCAVVTFEGDGGLRAEVLAIEPPIGRVAASISIRRPR
jgi:uncharacterized protein